MSFHCHDAMLAQALEFGDDEGEFTWLDVSEQSEEYGRPEAHHTVPGWPLAPLRTPR